MTAAEFAALSDREKVGELRARLRVLVDPEPTTNGHCPTCLRSPGDHLSICVVAEVRQMLGLPTGVRA